MCINFCKMVYVKLIRVYVQNYCATDLMEYIIYSYFLYDIWFSLLCVIQYTYSGQIIFDDMQHPVLLYLILVSCNLVNWKGEIFFNVTLFLQGLE